MRRSLSLALSTRPARGRPVAPMGSPPIPRGYDDAEVPDRARGRSPLTDLFPTFTVESAEFIEVPVSAADAPGAGNCAIFGLRSIVAGRDIMQDFCVFAAWGTMRSPDYDAGGAVSGLVSSAWGIGDAAAARRCALVVGVNTPIEFGRWVKWNAPAAGLHLGASGLRSTGERNPFVLVEPFPSGRLNTASQVTERFSRSWAPWVKRVPEGSKLDVGLAVAHEAGTWDDGTVFAGYAKIDLGLGLSENLERWGA